MLPKCIKRSSWNLYCNLKSHCYVMTVRGADISGLFLGNSSLNTFPQQRLNMQQKGTVGNGVLLSCLCWGVIRKIIGTTNSVLYGSLWRENLNVWSSRISAVKICYQETSNSILRALECVLWWTVKCGNSNSIIVICSYNL
jgi:DNA-binding transcriptional regulator of glucitol operon